MRRLDMLRLIDSKGSRLGADTFANPHTHTAALLAAGSVLAVTESVMRGETRAGIALVRPPGHHAEPDAAMGFCLLNNSAIAAAVARKRYGARRVLVLDWDVHHGNGTEACFVDDPSVMYISLHRYEPGFFPGTGHPEDVGDGAGAGFNVNIAWPEGGMRDIDYAAAFDLAVMPIARSFNPDLVIVSAGFDAAVDDPLGGCLITPAGFALMTARLRELAGGKMVVALEGGYNLAAIAVCTEAVTRVLLGEPVPALPAEPTLIPDQAEPLVASAGAAAGRALTSPQRQRSLSSAYVEDWHQEEGAPSQGEMATNHPDTEPGDAIGGSAVTHGQPAMVPQRAAITAIAATLEAHAPYWPVLRYLRRALRLTAFDDFRRLEARRAAQARQRESLAKALGGHDGTLITPQPVGHSRLEHEPMPFPPAGGGVISSSGVHPAPVPTERPLLLGSTAKHTASMGVPGSPIQSDPHSSASAAVSAWEDVHAATQQQHADAGVFGLMPMLQGVDGVDQLTGPSLIGEHAILGSAPTLPDHPELTRPELAADPAPLVHGIPQQVMLHPLVPPSVSLASIPAVPASSGSIGGTGGGGEVAFRLPAGGGLPIEPADPFKGGCNHETSFGVAAGAEAAATAEAPRADPTKRDRDTAEASQDPKRLKAVQPDH
jgi:histone deacetylase 6